MSVSLSVEITAEHAQEVESVMQAVADVYATPCVDSITVEITAEHAQEVKSGVQAVAFVHAYPCVDSIHV